MKTLTYENVLEHITKKNRLWRLASLLLGAFIIAFIYNSFIVPYNIVYGGVGGIAIIANKMVGIDTTLFINVATVLLTILSVILLGFKKTSYTIIGFLAYTVMVNFTTPLAQIINIEIDSFLFSVLVHGCIAGVGYGLLYKTGFNTGGVDTVVMILQHYLKLPSKVLSDIINSIIIIAGAIIFGITNSIYAVIYLKVMNFVADKVLLGSSTSKICFIKSRKLGTIEEYLIEKLDVGYTLLDSTNGIGFLHKRVIMCVLPADRFYDFKRELLNIDKRVEIISKDCYTVEGGRTNSLIKV